MPCVNCGQVSEWCLITCDSGDPLWPPPGELIPATEPMRFSVDPPL